MLTGTGALQIHSPRTTVREALQFSADLRFNGNPGRTALRAFVDEVMDLVELHPNRDALVRPCCALCRQCSSVCAWLQHCMARLVYAARLQPLLLHCVRPARSRQLPYLADRHWTG